jgi:hypothetical protein
MNKNTKNYKKIAFIAVFMAFFAFLSLGYAIASSITAERVVALVNQARSKAGLAPLQENAKLSAAAGAKAEDMLKNDYFAHNSPGGKTPWYWIERAGYNYKFAGENLAMNFESAEEEQKAWMDSPTHKKNILNSSYNDIGVGVKEGKIDGQSTTVVVQMFGSTPVVAPISEKAPAKAAENYEPEVLGQEQNKLDPDQILNDPKEDILVDDLAGPVEKAGAVPMGSFLVSIKEWLSSAVKADWLVPAALAVLWIIMIGNIFFLAYLLIRKIKIDAKTKSEDPDEHKIPVENLEEPEEDVPVAVKIHILHAAK